MPFFRVTTNIKTPLVKHREVMNKMTALVVNQTGKPEKFIMTGFVDNHYMTMNNSDKPLAFVEFKSIGLPDTKKLSSEICKLIHTELSIEEDRIYIEFIDEPRDKFGWNGTTF